MTKTRRNIILLIEPSNKPWVCSSKLGYLYMNRFVIDEDAEFELLGIDYLSQSFVNTRTYFGAHFKKKKEKFDETVIAAVMEMANKHKEFATLHLIIAADMSFYHGFDAIILREMKKHQIKSVLVTKLRLHQECLITREKMQTYCTEAILPLSPCDDLERMFEKLQYDKDEYTCLEASQQAIVNNDPFETLELETPNFFFPQLNEKEMEQVERKDVNYLRTFLNFTKAFETVDVDEAEMKSSESNSKYVKAVWNRRTYIIHINDRVCDLCF